MTHKTALSNLLQARRPRPASENVSQGRRNFLRGATAGTAAAATLGLAACSGSEDLSVAYDHGVASGDPLPNAVIVWTRITVPGTPDVNMTWQVATDAAFANIVSSGTVVATAARDYTVKADATGLQPATNYFYRFVSFNNVASPAGRTRTAAAATSAPASVRFAVFSCSNYPTGFFNVYAEAARRNDFDAILHLGDFIYEYERGGFASTNAATLGRLVEPANEIVSLADYRRRHAQYKTDPDSRALLALAPLIAVWDDHEFTNDAYMTGAENHQSTTEGSFAARRAVAVQAYHEWMPTRVNATNPDIIYRSFNFGNLVSLHMLDTRIIGRELQLDYNNFINPTTGALDAAGFTAAVSSPTRQLLGATQTTFLQNALTASTATWQVLGQQILMGRMNIPAPILFEALNPGTGVSVTTYSQLATRAVTNSPPLTPQEQAILAQPSIPYNLDAWDGYAAARETVLGTARALNRNLVVLAGDTHNAWASDLLDISNNQVGVEFATSSVTSPGFEEFLPNENPAVLGASLPQLIGPLVYTDTSRRGYMLLTATATECRADWIFVNTIASRTFTATVGRSLRTLPGAGNRRVVEV
ncbi:MAG: alkaline phosphatase D family protein [Burkholderiaceae bacterium]